MAKQDNQAPSQRQLRVGEEIRHALARILARSDLRDPDLEGQSITVTEARISPDLKNVTAFVMTLGGTDLPTVIAALNRAAPYLRSRLGREVRLRTTPRLSFRADLSFDTSARIDSLLADPRVSRDLARSDPAEENPGDGT